MPGGSSPEFPTHLSLPGLPTHGVVVGLGVVVGAGVVVGFGVVVGAGVVVWAVVVVGAGVVVCAGVVVGFGVVVAAGDAAAWAGATMEAMSGLDHLLGRTTGVETPPMSTFKTCRRSCRASFMVNRSPASQRTQRSRASVLPQGCRISAEGRMTSSEPTFAVRSIDPDSCSDSLTKSVAPLSLATHFTSDAFPPEHALTPTCERQGRRACPCGEWTTGRAGHTYGDSTTEVP